EFMFAGENDAGSKAKKIAEYLGDHNKFRSHGRAIKLPELIAQGVKVKDLSTMGNGLYEAVTILYSCLDIMLSNTGLYKLFENAEASIGRQQQQMTMQPFMQQIPVPTPQKLQ